MRYDILYNLVKTGKSTRVIAGLTGVCQTTVNYWLKKYNLKTNVNSSKISKKYYKIYRLCVFCKTPLQNGKQYRNKYCNNVCQNNVQYQKYIERWKAGLETGYRGKKLENSQHIRRWMFETKNRKCEECGWNKINKFTGKIPLQIDHIDGNFTNNKPENLRLLCPSCHSLTETWGRINKHPGRRRMGCM